MRPPGWAPRSPGRLGRAPRRGIRIGLACAEFNGGITDRLLTGALDALEEARWRSGRRPVAWVPGAFELPLVAQRLAESETVDAVICLGAVDPGRHRPLRVRGRRVRRRACSGCSSTPVSRWCSESSPPRPSTRPWCAPTDDPSNKGREAALTALHTAGALTAVSEASARHPGRVLGGTALMLRLVLPKGSLEKRHPRSVRRRRPQRHPVLGGRLPGHHRRSPGRARCGSSAPRRSPCTWPTASSTSASPDATGSRSGGATSPRSACSTTRRPPPTRSGWCWPCPSTPRWHRWPTWPPRPPGRRMRCGCPPSTPS